MEHQRFDDDGGSNHHEEFCPYCGAGESEEHRADCPLLAPSPNVLPCDLEADENQ